MKLQSLPRAYIRDPRPPPQLTDHSPCLIFPRESPHLAVVRRHPPWPPRPRLGSGHHRPPHASPPRPTHSPSPTQPPHPLAPSPYRLHHRRTPSPEASCPPMAPPLPSVPCLPGGRPSSGWVRLDAAVLPVAAPRPGIAGAGRPFGHFPPLPLLCLTGEQASGRKETTEPGPSPCARDLPVSGPRPRSTWISGGVFLSLRLCLIHSGACLLKIFTYRSLIFITLYLHNRNSK